jgi:hypothetical protein
MTSSSHSSTPEDLEQLLRRVLEAQQSQEEAALSQCLRFQITHLPSLHRSKPTLRLSLTAAVELLQGETSKEEVDRRADSLKIDLQ